MRKMLPGYVAMALACGTPLWAEAPAPATPALPTVVEMFTSKYCPNCPSAEIKMIKAAQADANLLVMFEHVDYWDEGPRKDPYGLAEVTQRQYDYGTAMGRRQGEVFTPMPLLNGTEMASPPLWLSWEAALRKARTKPVQAALGMQQETDGTLTITIPESLKPALKSTPELWVLALSPVPDTAVWRVRGVAQATVAGLKGRVPAATLPKVEGKPAPRYVALLQQPGPGAIVGLGTLSLR